jgi:hypothetical protein
MCATIRNDRLAEETKRYGGTRVLFTGWPADPVTGAPGREPLATLTRRYDPEYDSPEARAAFASRHITSLRARIKRRDELIARYRAEPVTRLFPTAEGLARPIELFRITLHDAYLHTILLSGETWQRINRHEPLRIAGTGFLVHGGTDQDFWQFNLDAPGSVRVYCDNGRELYTGKLDHLYWAELREDELGCSTRVNDNWETFRKR